MLVVLAAPFLASAAAKPPPLKATIAFKGRPLPATGQWQLDSIPTVIESSDQSFKEQLEHMFSTIPPASYRSDPVYLLGRFSFWLQKTYNNQGLVGGLIAMTRPPAADNTWTVIAPAPPSPYHHLIVRVYTTALPPVASPDPACFTPYRLAPFDPAMAEPTPRSQTLLADAQIQLEGTGTHRECPGANSSALPTILRLANQLAAFSADAYAESQDLGTYHAAIQARFKAALAQARLSSPYDIKVDFQPADSPPDTLVVEVRGLNPLFAAEAVVDKFDLPNDQGDHPTLERLRRLYGTSAFTDKLAAQAETLAGKLRTQLQTLAPPDTFPRFLNDAERAQLADRVQAASAQAEIVQPVESPSDDGTLLLDTTYLPSVATYTASLNGDSVRTLAGEFSAKYSHPWIKGDSLSGSFSAATTGYSADGGYGFPFSGWPVASITGRLRFDSDYALTRQVRLGTRTGPLVSVSDWQTGARLTLTRVWLIARPPAAAASPGTKTTWDSFTVENVLYPRARSLRGSGPDAFLGQPSSLAGFALSDDLTFGYAAGAWNLSAKLSVTRWFTSATPAYDTFAASWSARRTFTRASGASTENTAYLELRGSARRLSASAPRLDFARLGGDEWLRGLDDGELAGRSAQAFAVEGGPSLSTLLSLIPQKKPAPTSPPPPATDATAAPPQADPLKNVYLYGVVEYGTVGRQSGAGADFNPHRRAASYGLGARLLGGVPGLGNGGSVAFGYAWSPQSLRTSGRFFVTVFFLFGNP